MSKKGKDAPSKWQKFAEEEAEKQQEAEMQVRFDDKKEQETDVPVEKEAEGEGHTEKERDIEDLAAKLSTAEVWGQDDSQVVALELEVKKYKDVALRAEANMENIKRRAERDVSSAHKYANEKILKELLPVIDSLNRGIEGVDATDEELAPMIKGLEMTRELFDKTLTQFGVVIINPEKGSAFDPALHEAMTMQADPEAASNTILQVLEKGYQLNGRVLRAAMVIVAN